MIKNFLRRLFRIDETYELEMFEIPHLDASSGMPCGMMISRKRAADIGAIRIHGGPSYGSRTTAPYWCVQVDDSSGKYLCSTKKFYSPEEARDVQEELYRFFKSLAANETIVIVIRDFDKVPLAA